MQQKKIEVSEKYIYTTGDYGIVPQKDDDKRMLTGLRYIPELKKRMGRDITDQEWEALSIR